MMIRRLLKSMALMITEAGITLVVVGIFFLVVMAFLVFSFPRGTDLAQVVLPESLGGFSRVPSREVHLVSDSEDDQSEDSPLASVSWVSGRVREKAPDAIVWGYAHVGRDLVSRHTVQTLDRSGAAVSFSGKETLRLQENSLVIIKDYKKLPGIRHRQAGLIVLEGELRGRMKKAERSRDDVVVLAATREAVLRPRGDTGEEVDFSVKVNPDQTATVAVYTGSTELRVGSESMEVEANEFVTLGDAGMLSAPQPLPSAPALDRPARDAVFYYSSVSTAVQFKWTGDEIAESYDFVLARDPEFQEIVHRETVDRPIFRHGNLKSGEYYWRVHGLTGWAEGPASEARRFEVTRDVEPPILTVHFPEGAIREKTLLVTGATDPGVDVYVGDAKISVDTVSGEFEHWLPLSPGLNVVVVTALDRAGNAAYESRIVNAQF